MASFNGVVDGVPIISEGLRGVHLNEHPKILKDVLEYIGNTPLIRLNRIPKSMGIECEVLAKCELFSAGGSHKDRIAVRMIEDLEREGKINPDTTIIEPTSGNTGIGVAMVCAVKGYKCILVMPEKMSNEKMDTMNALGSTIIRTPGVPYGHPDGHINVATRLHKETPNSIMLNQYDNECNPQVHYEETAEEVIEQCDGKIDMCVIGAGTGGAISGIGRKFKEKIPSCVIVGVDPEGSIMAEPDSINENAGKFWEIEGIGHDFLPEVFDRKVVDKWVKVKDIDSLTMARRVIAEEGLLVGGSSGSAVMGALMAIKEAGLGPDKRVVIIIPDSIRNYMSKFLSDQWMLERGFFPTDDLEKRYKSWWNVPISDLPQSSVTPVTATAETTVEQAISLLEENSLAQIPVVSSEGTITGIVTLETIMKKLIGREISRATPVTKAQTSQFKKLPVNSTLGKLSCTLSGHPFAVIVKPKADNPKQEYPVSVLTRMDLLKYLNQQEF